MFSLNVDLGQIITALVFVSSVVGAYFALGTKFALLDQALRALLSEVSQLKVTVQGHDRLLYRWMGQRDERVRQDSLDQIISDSQERP